MMTLFQSPFIVLLLMLINHSLHVQLDFFFSEFLLVLAFSTKLGVFISRLCSTALGVFPPQQLNSSRDPLVQDNVAFFL